ncbi:ATP-binding protein [Actinokineospora guangxiensis]|uniref:ATP-binding protein n=1 Tax=Actinokineospora guangxiensis TaxID=1490288 RepID=A0ABW0EMU1_9PSEU
MNSAFIGRDHPARVLRAEVDRVRDSHGGLVLVAGEAGIGKTTLVTTAADEARRQGTLVLSGSCWDSDSVPGLWPWVQVVRALRRAASPEQWARAESAAGAALAALLGEQRGETPEFPVFDAVTTALVAVSQDRPVMVVLDDLHWADPASVKLLAFAAQHAWFERLLMVGTYRDVELEAAGHPLEPLIFPLVAKATTLTLTGLTADEVGDLIALTGVDRPDPALVAEVHRRTGGNPFFVEQTARLWHGSGAVAVPPGVRDAVQRRLAALPAETRALLATAAALGREFDSALLAAATGNTRVERTLARAVTARLVAPVDQGRYTFVHDLVRESLDEAADDRRAVHAAVARALDADSALAAAVFPADRARHAHLGVPDYPAERAVELLVAAARDAIARLAMEEAVAHLRRAVPLAEPERKVFVLVELGGCQLRNHENERGWGALREAAELARGLDSDQPLVRAAVTLYQHGPPTTSRLTNDTVREAHRRITGRAEPDTDTPLEAVFRELVVKATARARTGDDDDALSMGLWAQHDLALGLGTARERLDLITELTRLAATTDDSDMEWFAASMRWVALLELGDPAYLEQFRDTMALRDASPRNALSAGIDETIIFTLTGRFAEAGAHLDGYTADDMPDWYQMLGYMRWLWLMRQGRYAEAPAVVAERMAGFEHPEVLRAITDVETGRVEAALRRVRATVAKGETFLSHERPLWLRLLAHTAALARDTELIKLARKELSDHSGGWLVAYYGFDVSGPVDLWLGALHVAERKWDDAIAHLGAAVASAEAMEARPWSVDARAWLARAHAGRAADATDPASRAADESARDTLITGVAADAARLGMTQYADTASATETAPTPPPASVPRFSRDGEVWTLAYDGVAVHMPDAKGLRDLHTLLANPGADIPAAELVGAPAVAAVTTAGADDVLDDRAKAEFRARLSRLDTEIDNATALGNDRRAATLDTERAALLDHLRLAAGLSGRTRRLGDESERARKAVTARIRDTIRKLRELHPPLAAHLRETVTTGTACRYDGAVAWRLR